MWLMTCKGQLGSNAKVMENFNYEHTSSIRLLMVLLNLQEFEAVEALVKKEYSVEWYSRTEVLVTNNEIKYDMPVSFFQY